MTFSKRYIEIVGGIGVWRHYLVDVELHSIGSFTGENVLRWLENHTACNWAGVFPVEDFHAVCGDIDIPWATKEGFDCYQLVQARAEQRMREREVVDERRKKIMKSLIVGQEVLVECGHYKSWGKVVKVAPSGVGGQLANAGRLQFDNTGKGSYITETYDCPGPRYMSALK